MKRLKSLLFIFLFILSACQSPETENQQISKNFTRDVMMPLGLPVVSSYHLMREHYFLNTKVKGSSLLETLGDFVLTPSQYLFGGKTIEIGETLESPYQVYPSFQYQEWHYLKVLASLVVLPFSEVIGAGLKTLAYLSQEVRERNKRIKNSLLKAEVRSHLDTYRSQEICSFHSDEWIPCQGYQRPSNLLKKQIIEIEALKKITDILNQNQIIWWIDCGTCLGAYRYGGMIPWDWDIDISILLPDHTNVKKLLLQLDSNEYEIQDWSSYDHPETFLKLYVKKTKNFIDIYHYKIDEAKQELAYFFTFQDSLMPHSWKKEELRCTKPLRYRDIFPLKKAKFDELILWAPNDVVTFLQSKYGENLSPAKIWDESTKSYKKVENHPYYQ